MNNELLQFQLILLSSSVITLFYIYDRELSKSKISILFSVCNISIFLIETRMIGNSQYLTIAAALFLIFKYYTKQPDETYIPQINILKTQVSEHPGKIDQEMEQYPQYLPAIQSIHEESNSNMTPKQIPVSNENINGPQNTTERGKQHIKQDSMMGFLGDKKRSSYTKNNTNSVIPQRQQTSQLTQANFNVIKFQDDCGEIKFGLLKTLKSINFDQLGKEIEIIYQNDKTLTRLLSNIEKKSGPRMQILYESQQPANPIINDNLRGGIQLDYGNNDQLQINEQKQVTWKKIFQVLSFQIALICNLLILEQWQIRQIVLFSFICFRYIFVFSKLKIKQLEFQLEFRQIIIWSSLIFLPLISLFILNLIEKNIAQIINSIAQLISIMITLKYYKSLQEHPYSISFYILLLAIILCFI
ncbi:unnamed protein product [Paramecium primaurelia]|uniref:Transmembrane protein n=1 Tax=Paramecium primaurelia TaxID=5886 RepID=A0A8S1N687_PARPR|nr:unnamed protein product [Paramecium primaurelia]